MAGVGFLMDRLQIRKAMWAVLFVGSALVIFVAEIKSYPTIQHALSKHGSWWAYVFFSVNMGLYLAILLSFFGKGLKGALRMASKKGVNSATANRAR